MLGVQDKAFRQTKKLQAGMIVKETNEQDSKNKVQAVVLKRKSTQSPKK